MGRSENQQDESDQKRAGSAVEQNGRLSNIEVAERVGVSHSSCSRRISRLERDGVILDYRALTDRQNAPAQIEVYESKYPPVNFFQLNKIT